ncbi:hypothetical protein [Clostridium sp. D33t1_170424_F3]|uniref:hypothetical protein n=1 Tax=Clostridium sp. D33t1_170424_F3 TaxID=2787099 RepID=UPI0018A999D0|nr:hypothetical protein [Clostridium sp. D33t1_170424_F3]
MTNYPLMWKNADSPSLCDSHKLGLSSDPVGRILKWIGFDACVNTAKALLREGRL